MSRFSVLALAIAVAGCALAGRDNGTGTDATPTSMDAPRAGDASTDAPRIDAPPPIDAAIDAAPQDLCTSSATCAAATALTPMDGDDEGQSQDTASGYQEAWYQVRVTEGDDSIFAEDMEVYVELTSPPSAQYDLYVYLAGDATSTNCTTAATTTVSGTVQTVSLDWGESGTFADDVDNSATVSVEVRPHPGVTCAPGAPWNLSFEGGY